jgi:hypothetical protein
VGAYLGLVPASDQSGASDPEKHISKHGNKMMRQLLVGSAHYILGPFGEDSDLRRHGEKIASRGGKNAKKRAVVAVARESSRWCCTVYGLRRRSTSRSTMPAAPIEEAKLPEGDLRHDEYRFKTNR